MPDPSRKHSTNQPGTRAEPARQLIQSGRLRWLFRLPLGSLGMDGVYRPPVPRAGQTARPGIQEGCTMTEASVSFAGNLTDDPEVRYTEGGIARLGVRSECTWHAASRATPSPSPSPSGSVVSSPSP
jgi:hypothetical protein